MLKALRDDDAICRALEFFLESDQAEAEVVRLEDVIGDAQGGDAGAEGTASRTQEAVSDGGSDVMRLAGLLDDLRRSSSQSARQVRPTELRPTRPAANFTYDLGSEDGPLADGHTYHSQLETRLDAARTARADAERRGREALAVAQQRAFEDGQQARAVFGAIKLLLPVKANRVPVAWRCLAFGVVHPGPHGCAAPHRGGIWLYEDEVGMEEVVID